jgi:lipoate-protein ligase A
MSLRLVDTDLCTPPYSAAADEAIASSRADGLVPDTLHFYRRDKPTVSLGYFQSVSEDIDLEFCHANDISVIRRATGGSAVFTDENQLIYALVVGEDWVPEGTNETYENVCSAIVAGLASLGVEAEYKPINDILVDGAKISGSAQMRRWGVVLQHGTLILDLDREMMRGALRADPEKISRMSSLAGILGHRPQVRDVREALLKGFEEVLGARFEPGALSDREQELTIELISEKYDNDDWNLKR